MSEEHKEVDVFESNRFSNALKKLPETHLKAVEDEIDKIIENPKIGELKKGDLSHMRVHKFKVYTQQILLGYTWVENKIEIYLLQLSGHENFYRDAKKKNSDALKLINS
jgi:mRNA-degrading endonuclease RelE of RelBE toxin-antitoxin system